MARQILETQNPQERLACLVQQSSASSLRLEKIPVKGYEQVIKVTDPKANLNAIIAIHDTTLGPALGGVRILPYASSDDALKDVLRLAKGMTYKSAMAEVGFGGGKSVIIASQKTPEMFYSMGRAIDQLGGQYIAAEDVGCTSEDCNLIRRTTQYVVGLPQKKSSGNPSPFTAWGVFRGIQSAAKKLFGSDSLEGRTVAIQGLGSVGSQLAEFLFWAGAELIIADIDPKRVERLSAKLSAKSVHPDQILFSECDILAPCALGGILNDQTIPELKCRAIAGCANNQLLKDSHADDLKNRGILYAPDFVINAGGLINVAAELEETGYCSLFPRAKTHRIYDCLCAIYDIAEKNHQSTHEAAIALSDYRIKYGIGKRLFSPTFHHVIE